MQELEALQHPLESSGTWAPDELLTKKTEDQLVAEFQDDLNNAFGSFGTPESVAGARPCRATPRAPAALRS